MSCKLKGPSSNLLQIPRMKRSGKARARPMQHEMQVPKRRRYHLTENHEEVFLIPPSLGIHIYIYILRLLF